jgi:hypothetical protein
MLKHLTALALFLIPVLVIFSPGCSVTATKQAATIRDHSISQAQKIEAATQSAQTHIANADQAVTGAIAQPNNPPQTSTSLAVAHTELGAAAQSLAPIGTATAAIKSDAASAANLTAVVDKQLQKEKAGFFSDRQKKIGVILLILIVIGAVVAILTFVGQTAGYGPIFSVLTDILSVGWQMVKSTAGVAIKTTYHVGTLGLAFVGAEFGKAVAKKAATSTVPTRLAPPPAKS